MIASPYGRACVIVMTLARIGNDPDLKRLAAIRSIGGGREIYGAGGIRDAADLSALKAAGPSGRPDRDRPPPRAGHQADLEAI